jgi:hypothetical protein
MSSADQGIKLPFVEDDVKKSGIGLSMVFAGAFLLNLVGTSSAVTVALKVDTVKYVLSGGIGGDYCFNITSPICQTTLDSLNPACARVEFLAQQWEPDNKYNKADSISYDSINWNYFNGRDASVRNNLLMAQKLTQRGIPYVMTIWSIPGWLANSNKGISPNMWPAAAECIISYILYGKKNYNTEPDYFSFNESDIGINVLFTDTTTREFIRFMGPRFAAAGLKTKFALGDVSVMCSWNRLSDLTIKDTSLQKYIGVLAFHSWDQVCNNDPNVYNVINNYSRSLNIPVWCTEAGVNAFIWNNPTVLKSWDYGMREMRLYSQLLTNAQVQGICFWEYTDDYTLPGNQRFYIMKQWSMTEKGSIALNSHEYPAGTITLNGNVNASDATVSASFHFMPFLSPDKKRLLIHLPNYTRKDTSITITGIPVPSFDVVRTDSITGYAKQPSLTVTNNSVTVRMPALSLTTLTGALPGSGISAPAHNDALQERCMLSRVGRHIVRLDFGTIANRTVRLVSLNGKTVFSRSVHTDKCEFSMSDLPKGTYVVFVTTEGGRPLNKLLIVNV